MGVTDIVQPLRKMVHRTHVGIAEVETIDLVKKKVRIVDESSHIVDDFGIITQTVSQIVDHGACRSSKPLPHTRKGMEPMAGIEPATDGLRNRCSTAELHWLLHPVCP